MDSSKKCSRIHFSKKALLTNLAGKKSYGSRVSCFSFSSTEFEKVGKRKTMRQDAKILKVGRSKHLCNIFCILVSLDFHFLLAIITVIIFNFAWLSLIKADNYHWLKVFPTLGSFCVRSESVSGSNLVFSPIDGKRSYNYRQWLESIIWVN